MSKIQLNYRFSAECGDFSLTSPNGIRIVLSPLGASVREVCVPDRAGNIQNIALPSQSDGDYAGATLGPVAGRIAGARLPLGGEVLPLTANDGPNTLHGGAQNLSRQYWHLHTYGEDRHNAWLEFDCTLPHGLDGFPGNRTFTARYTLAGNMLTIQYTARTDRPTFVNLSNHTYWNLTGDFSADCYGQLLELSAGAVLYNDAQHLPASLQNLTGTAFDFSAPVSLREGMKRARGTELDTDKGQLVNANGYNNGFRLLPDAPFAARLSSPVSGRCLTLTTDQPWLVVYSGGYLPVPGCALALEAQQKPGSVTPLLLPKQTYRRTIRFAFDVVDG